MIDRESLVLRSYYLDNPALRPFHAIIRPEQFQEPGTSMLFTSALAKSDSPVLSKSDPGILT
jgi:hypothetical protein